MINQDMEEYKAEVEYHFSAINNELYTLKQCVANGTWRVVGEKVDLCSRNSDIKFKEMSSELGKLKQEVLCDRTFVRAGLH
jgi:hypothetical protein